MQTLQSGAILQGGKYRIEKVLGQGGFGITYLAVQSGLERNVAVKEFFMKELCERDEATSHVTLGTSGSAETVGRFREKFLKEARNIARLDHPNIVSVIDVFEENGTAYYVMKYAANGSLADKVKREGYLPEPVATRYVLQIADALDYIHQQKMNHLDVKPANIMLSEKDEAVLIDFGLSKQYDAATGNQTSTTPVGISEGYAPMEQYMQGGLGAFSPETDIYSLGATFYKLLTGVTPPNASFVNNEGLPLEDLKIRGVSQKAIDVICKAMGPRKKDRMKDGHSFIDGLNNNAASSSSEVFATVDEEATILTPAMQRAEEERKRQEAKEQAEAEVRAKAAREKAEAEARAKEEVDDSPTRLTDQQYSGSQKKSLWIALIAVVLVGAVVTAIGLGAGSKDSDTIADRTQTDSTAAATVIDVANPYQGYEWVDLGLPSGTKWATTNVGASSPSDYGNYYAWGETSTKGSYNWSNLKYCPDSTGDKFSKYVIDSDYGNVDGKQELDQSDDAAYVNWGSGWRMPSLEQIKELKEKCTWTWTSMDGHNGYKVVGKNGNSLFLPAAGFRVGSSSYFVGSGGDYWSRSLNTIYGGVYVSYLNFDSDNYDLNGNSRSCGQSVRPVLAP